MRWSVEYKGRVYKFKLWKYELPFYEGIGTNYHILDGEGLVNATNGS